MVRESRGFMITEHRNNFAKQRENFVVDLQLPTLILMAPQTNSEEVDSVPQR